MDNVNLRLMSTSRHHEQLQDFQAKSRGGTDNVIDEENQDPEPFKKPQKLAPKRRKP